MRAAIHIALFLLYGASAQAYMPGMEDDSIALRLAKTRNDTSKVKLYFKLEGRYYLSEPNRALRYNRAGLKLSKQLGYKTGMAGAYNNMGIIYSNKAEFPKALDNFQKSVTIYTSLGKMNKVGIVQNNIGRIYVIKEEYDRALTYFEMSLKQARKQESKRGIAYALIGIGVVLKQQGEENNDSAAVEKSYQLALEKYKEALALVIELDLIQSIAIVYNNIAGIQLKRSEYEAALENYEKCIDIQIETDDKKGEALSYHNMGEALHELGRYQDAIVILERSIEIAQSIDYKMVTSGAYQMLAVIHYELGKYEAAFNYRILRVEVSKLIFNEDVSQEMGKLEAKHEFEMAEKDEERFVREQEELERASENRRNNLQYSGILIFLVLLFVGVFFLRGVSMPIKLTEGLIFFTFLLFFEFTLVLLDPYIETYSQGEPAFKLLFNAVLAGLIFPLHSFFEERLKGQVIN